MTAHARDSLRLFVAALETHLEAVASRRSPNDAAVDDAYDAVAEAFERYEEALDLEFAEALPLVLEDSTDDDVIDTDDEDDEDDEDDDEDVETFDPHHDEDALDDDLEEFDLR